jgi:hypothetical protein
MSRGVCAVANDVRKKRARSDELVSKVCTRILLFARWKTAGDRQEEKCRISSPLPLRSAVGKALTDGGWHRRMRCHKSSFGEEDAERGEGRREAQSPT